MANLLTPIARWLSAQPWLARNSGLVVVPDRFLLKLTRGRFGLLSLVAMDELVLHTIGQRSGQPRDAPLLCVDDGGRLLVAGSNWGKPQLPAWVHNVRSGGPVAITRQGTRSPVTIAELTGPERDMAFARIAGQWSMFHRYAERAGRVIPVFAITPVTSP